MSETKFTKGPMGVQLWIQLYGMDGRDVYVVKAQPSPMARGFTKEVATFYTEHDAKLFVAASDLYAALEELLSACDEHDESNGKQMIDPHAERHARAALARARGETE